MCVLVSSPTHVITHIILDSMMYRLCTVYALIYVEACWFYRVGILRPSKMDIGCPSEIKWTSRCGERNKRKTRWLLQSIIFGKMADPRGKLSLVKFPLTTWVDLHLPSKLVRHSMLKMLTLKAFNTNHYSNIPIMLDCEQCQNKDVMAKPPIWLLQVSALDWSERWKGASLPYYQTFSLGLLMHTA